MSGTFSAQAGAEPGYALLRVAGRADLAVRRTMVLRVPDLSNRSFPPAPVEAEGADLLMRLGPDITDHLDTDTPYMLVLPDAGLTGNVVWPRIVPPRAGARRVIDLPGSKIPPRTGEPTAQAVPPTGGTTSISGGNETRPVAPIQPVHGRRRWMPALAAGGALTALIFGAWWLFLRSSVPTQISPGLPSTASLLPTTGSDSPGGQRSNSGTSAVLPPSAMAPGVSAAPPGVDPKSQLAATLAGLSVREVIARAGSPLAIDQEGGRRLQAGQPDDGVLLLEAAAEKGDPSAMAHLAELYDPDGFDPKGPIPSPDAREAARYYRDAAQAGNKDVDAPRTVLHTKLQEEAQGGNLSAKLALQDFWP